MVDWKAYLRAQLALRGRVADDRDTIEELAQHLQARYAEAIAAGASDAEARQAAIDDLGNLRDFVREIARVEQPPPPPLPAAGVPASPLRSVPRDIRYAVRLMRRQPAFTFIAIFTLALGLGANTAIFTVVHAVLLRPLPYAEPARLITAGERDEDVGSDRFAGNTGYATFVDWRTRARSFDTLVAIRSWQAMIYDGGDGGDAERLSGMRVTSDYFRMLGVAPALGRSFEAADDRPDTRFVVILSDALWRRRFNGDPSVIGRPIKLNDRPFTVIGVMPRDYEPIVSAHFYQPAELWAPLGYDVAGNDGCRSCQHLKVLGRLAPQTTIEQAQIELNTIQTTLRTEHPKDYSNVPVAVIPLSYELTGRIQPALYVLMGGVGFVLLIACANVANLLLARAGGRRMELAVRAALGASRRRLAQQLLTESVLLALAGGVVGFAASALVVPLLARLAPVEIGSGALERLGVASGGIAGIGVGGGGGLLGGPALDPTIFLFALALATLTGLLFGLAPAWQVARVDVQTTLRQGGRQLSGSGSSLARRTLVVIDLALALVLLLGAGVMLRSVQRLLDQHPGFEAEHVLTAQLAFVGTTWATDPPVRRATDAVLERVRALPGVAVASVASQIPLGGNMDKWGFHIEGRSAANPAQDPSVERYSVSVDYFSAMRIPLIRGRLISTQDGPEAPLVMVISDTTARTIFPGEDPIGKRVRIPSINAPWRTIVGIAGDVRHYDVALPPTPQMYLPQAQITDSFPVLTIRTTTSSDPRTLVAAVRDAVRGVDRTITMYDIATLDDLVSRSMRSRWFVMLLLSGFAAIAVVMAAVGVYGVVASLVTQRTRELGIRLALGAHPRDLQRLLIRGGLVLTAAGVAIGIALGAALGQLLRSLTYQVSPLDPLVFVACGLLLGGVTLAAHWIPIRRAMRLDPVIALRQE